MPMPTSTDTFIDNLVSELEPVRPLSQAGGLSRAAMAILAATVIAAFGIGLRPDLLAGKLDPVFLLSSGLFLLLTCAASFSVIQMSRPQVGNHQTGWLWATAMAALLPASALLTALVSLAKGNTMVVGLSGWNCMAMGAALGLILAVMLTAWLRRGAPTSPQRAGLLIGIASGSAGIFAFSLHCTHNDIGHIGLWHGLAVAVNAGLGRLVIPSAIKW